MIDRVPPSGGSGPQGSSNNSDMSKIQAALQSVIKDLKSLEKLLKEEFKSSSGPSGGPSTTPVGPGNGPSGGPSPTPIGPGHGPSGGPSPTPIGPGHGPSGGPSVGGGSFQIDLRSSSARIDEAISLSKKNNRVDLVSDLNRVHTNLDDIAYGRTADHDQLIHSTIELLGSIQERL